MNNEYLEKVLAIGAYCVVQYKLLGLYDSSYDTLAMLEDIAPLVIKRNLIKLKELSITLSERIKRLREEKPGIAGSNHVRDLVDLVEEKKQQYQRLCNPQYFF